MSELAAAGTVVVLRDGVKGSEVLLMQRPDRGSFPGSWVFPGGKVDPIDESDAEESLVLGVRVGQGHPDAVSLIAAARAAVRETDEEVGLRVSDVVPLSCWTPPVGIPKRLRTWFFLAADPGTSVVAAPDEVVDFRWVRPEDALDEHAAGTLRLMPPTWVVLRLLRGHRSVEALQDEASATFSRHGIEQFHTVVTHDGSDPSVGTGPLGTGHLFVWDGDEQHPELPGSAGDRHRLDTSTRPWRYERTAMR